MTMMKFADGQIRETGPLGDALWFSRTLGISIIPLKMWPKEDRKKPALPEGDEYLNGRKKADDKQLFEWFLEPGKHNLGVKLGQISDGLVLLDIDGAGKKRYEEKSEEFSVNLRTTMANTTITTTGSGNYGILVKVSASDLKQLEQILGCGDKAIWRTNEEGHSEIRIKMNGFAVVAPSINKDDKEYESNNKAPSLITLAELEEFIRIMGDGSMKGRSLVQERDLWNGETKIREGGRHKALLSLANSLVAKMPKENPKLLRNMLHMKNELMCEPPLPKGEIDQIWNDALKYQAKETRDDGNGKAEKPAEEPELKEFYVQKYTNGILFEAVIVGGMPFFLQLGEKGPRLTENIETASMKLLPIDPSSYLNKPYEFKSLEELKSYIDRAKSETFDSLYIKIKGILAKYMDGDSDQPTIMAADILFTYFQDKLGQTHYLFFVGDSGCGKSNRLELFAQLAYRALHSGDVTPANIYSYLGGIEEGQGTILEDEADNIDIDKEKMKIYKMGYNAGKKVPRIDLSSGRKQQVFWTYCFKAFTAEKLPDKDRAKGFLERTFVMKCSPGNPQFDISEVINPAGDEEFEELRAELVDLRKLLLAFRMIHFKDPFPNVKLSVNNREKQLCKPLLRLFQTSECRKEIGKTLANLLSEKRGVKRETLEAKMYGVIEDLVGKLGLALSNTTVYEAMKDELNGDPIPSKTQCFYSTEHGQVSMRKITDILVDKFGGERARDNKTRLIKLDQRKLDRLKISYDLPEAVEILQD